MSAYKTVYNNDGGERDKAYKTIYNNDGGKRHTGGEVPPKPPKQQPKDPPPRKEDITITCKFCKKEYRKPKNAFVACPRCGNYQ